MLPAPQMVGVATVPLNVTVLVPCVVPKVVPVIVTDDPTAPEVGLRLMMCGATVKLMLLLVTPPTVTTTFPVVAPDGTGTTMLPALQLVGVACVPLKVTALAPCVAPKVVPVIVTDDPTAPEVGLRLLMCGITVKLNPWLATPPTVTTTFPVVAPDGTGTTMLVALQLIGVADVPLNVTVLVPCVVPKFDPAIVTDVPTAPEFGVNLFMIGAGGGTITVNSEALLAWLPTVTTTLPVIAPLGTGTTMLVALQLVAVPVEIPLNVTVLVPCVAPKFVPVIVTGAPTTPEEGARLVMLGGGFEPPFPPPSTKAMPVTIVGEFCSLAHCGAAPLAVLSSATFAAWPLKNWALWPVLYGIGYRLFAEVPPETNMD